MSESTGYVHIDGDRYYRIRHRYPFIFVYDYLEYIPDPLYSDTHGADLADLGIIIVVLAAAFVGLVASMQRLKVFELLCSDYHHNFHSTRTAKAKHKPDNAAQIAALTLEHDGFEQPEQQPSRMDRVMRRVWGAMGGAPSRYAAYSSLPCSSEDDLTALSPRQISGSYSNSSTGGRRDGEFSPLESGLSDEQQRPYWMRVKDRGYHTELTSSEQLDSVEEGLEMTGLAAPDGSGGANDGEDCLERGYDVVDDALRV